MPLQWNPNTRRLVQTHIPSQDECPHPAWLIDPCEDTDPEYAASQCHGCGKVWRQLRPAAQEIADTLSIIRRLNNGNDWGAISRTSATGELEIVATHQETGHQIVCHSAETFAEAVEQWAFGDNAVVE